MTKTLKPYGEMVHSLFKGGGYHARAEALTHAAIGIIGEVVELGNSTDRDNTIEESGDLEFYIEAAVQSLVAMPATVPVLEFDVRKLVALHVEKCIEEGRQITFQTIVMQDMLTAAADLLDLSKKLWIYGKPLDEDMTVALCMNIGRVLANLRRSYTLNELTVDAVREANQLKLGIRYPAGVFSEQHAQQRLDKVEFAATCDTEGGSND